MWQNHSVINDDHILRPRLTRDYEEPTYTYIRVDRHCLRFMAHVSPVHYKYMYMYKHAVVYMYMHAVLYIIQSLVYIYIYMQWYIIYSRGVYKSALLT